jgi:hypothetical protein
MISLETLFEDEDYRKNVELDPFFQKGREETQKQTAIKLKELGFATELIAQVTNIPIEEIELI